MSANQAPPPPSAPIAASLYSRHARFIRDNTMILAPPLVPELVLHLAEESLPIWLKTEEELQQANVDPPYWAFAWAGGQALARYILDHPSVVMGKRVLDLGAGSGLVAIAARRAGAAFVMAADIDPLAAVAAKLNADLNRVSLHSTADDLLAGPSESYDVILAGDLFYEAPLAQRVLKLIEVAAMGGAEVLAGDPRRSYFPADRFEKITEYSVPVSRQLEDLEIRRTAVWRLKNVDALTP